VYGVPYLAATLRSAEHLTLTEVGVLVACPTAGLVLALVAWGEEMRDGVHRVGDHLQTAYGYRGAFGIDGVLTADGFRPTELNTRMSAGFAQVMQLDRKLFGLLQDAVVLGEDVGVKVADLEGLLPLIDADPSGRAVALAKDVVVGDITEALMWDGTRFDIAPRGLETENVLVMADTPSGLFARVEPCAALRPGVRLATVNLALYDLLRREFDIDMGRLSAAPDLRRPGRDPGD
jgi:hypothetical protein